MVLILIRPGYTRKIDIYKRSNRDKWMVRSRIEEVRVH